MRLLLRALVFNAAFTAGAIMYQLVWKTTPNWHDVFIGAYQDCWAILAFAASLLLYPVEKD